MASSFALARYHEDGSLDTSFHGDGKVLTEFPTRSWVAIGAIAVDGRDRIVAGGVVENKFALARYTEDGNLDTSFRGDGTVITDFRSTESESINALCIDHRNRIVVAGGASGRMALARYWEDGALDSSFDGDGKVLTDFRSAAREGANAVALDQWGRIVVGGWADGKFALARYSENGSLDPSFHGDGKVLTDFASSESERIRALAIDRHGRIVVGGVVENRDPPLAPRFALARYTVDGDLDPGFHGDGKVITDFRSTREEAIRALAIDGGDRIVVGGIADDTFALARYTEDGILDPSFNGDGKVITDFRSTSFEWINALALDRLGRIVVAGIAGGKFALARYTYNGNLDPSFDRDGKVITDFRSTFDEEGNAIAIDSHGRIVVGGTAMRAG